MKQIAIVLALCVGAWYFFVGGRKLDEAGVRAHYDKEVRAYIARDGDAICKQMSKKIVVNIKVSAMGGESVEGTRNHDEACEESQKGFTKMSDALERNGGDIPIAFDYKLDRVEVATDRRSATVEGTKTAKIAGGLISIKTNFTDEFVSEVGQVRLIKSDMHVFMRFGAGSAMSQSDFFRK